MGDQRYELTEAFEAFLQSESEKPIGEGLVQWTEPLVSYPIGTPAVPDIGFVAKDPNDDSFIFELSLGPVNANKLLSFIHTLPKEPDDD